MENNDDLQKEIQDFVRQQMEKINAQPERDFDGLSPHEAHQLLYYPFKSGSPVKFKMSVSNQVVEKIPFYRLFKLYLDKIEQAGELKLTDKGNLRRKTCQELYGAGIIKERFIESGVTKLNKESDSIILQNLKQVGLLSGITKKRHNKLSLTKKGKELYQSQKQMRLFREIFETNFYKFNIGFHDGYPEAPGIQHVFGFSLFLLLKYGREKRKAEFYTKKVLKAFPALIQGFGDNLSTPEEEFKRCYTLRTFSRGLCYYGFVDMEEEKVPDQYFGMDLIQATDLLEKVFRYKEQKQR